MKSLTITGDPEEIVSRPYVDESLVRVHLGSALMMAVDKRVLIVNIAVVECESIGLPWLVLYYDHGSGCEVEMDELHEFRVDAGGSFFWSEFQSYKQQTRGSAKNRLRSLGFDPHIIDRVFPVQSAARRHRLYLKAENSQPKWDEGINAVSPNDEGTGRKDEESYPRIIEIASGGDL